MRRLLLVAVVLLLPARAVAQEFVPLPPSTLRAPATFPQAPAAVRAFLQARGCRLAVVPSWSGAQGLVRGQYDGRGALDWVALCERAEARPVAYVFWGGAATRPDSVPDSLLGAPSGGRSVLLHAPRAVVRRYQEGCCGAEAAREVRHDGLELMGNASFSTLWYWNGREWEQLAGAD